MHDSVRPLTYNRGAAFPTTAVRFSRLNPHSAATLSRGDPVPILAIATSKGGSGKTTLAACLADHWNRNGRRVRCLDTDPNQNLLDWLRQGETGIQCAFVEEEAIIDQAAAASEEGDWVIVDVAGSLSRGLLYAISVADAVLIPCKADRKDVLEACRTQEVIQSAAKMTRRAIPHAAIITQVNRRAEVTRHTREQLSVMGVPVLTSDLPARTAYQQASYTGAPLADAAVRDDVAAIAAEAASLVLGTL